MRSVNVDWPRDADGDALRRMRERGFNFHEPCIVDFNVDFEAWPPEEKAIHALREQFPGAKLFSPEDESPGYILFQMHVLLTYDLVTTIQRQVTELMARYGGTCDTWGVLY
jgi:hypothetical protein